MVGPCRIVFTAQAEGDLQLIYDQRLRQRGSEGPDGADALLDELYEAVARLADYPHSGPVPRELEPLGMGEWRQLSHWPYRIIYAVESDVVTIAIVADSRRDFAELLERRVLRKPPLI